jgi:hypothetical protein
MKINLISATDMRIKEAFDFIKVRQDELTDGQAALIKSLKEQFRTRGLTDKQTQILFEIKRNLSPLRT